MPASTRPPNSKTKFPTIADVQERLGHIPESRIRSFPAPGTATVQDLLDSSLTGDRLHELVDGILVEKGMGYREGSLALWLGTLINLYLIEHNIGHASGADGMIRFKLDLVRMPDLSFIRWDSVDDPNEIENPSGAFLEVPPDLAVEVLSPSNTRREMEIKLEEYAKAGVKLVWYVDPERKEVDVYPKGNAKRKRTLGVNDTLDGGEVLPGFSVKVGRIFESRAPQKKGGRKGKK
jgi:Uma2 family endonuclease